MRLKPATSLGPKPLSSSWKRSCWGPCQALTVQGHYSPVETEVHQVSLRFFFNFCIFWTQKYRYIKKILFIIKLLWQFKEEFFSFLRKVFFHSYLRHTNISWSKAFFASSRSLQENGASITFQWRNYGTWVMRERGEREGMKLLSGLLF